MRTKGSAAELKHRRQLAIERLHEGHSTEEVAELLGIHIRIVQKWKARHDKQGDAGLASKPALGRMPKLTDRQAETVLSWFTKSPREFGYKTDLWTSRRVRKLIQKKFRATFNSNYLCNWLTARHITPQKSERQAKQRDEDRIQTWLRDDWPGIVKRGNKRMPTLSWSMRPVACSLPLFGER